MSEHSFQFLEREFIEIDKKTSYVYVVDDALEGIRTHETKVHQAFDGLTEKHIKASRGLMELLPYNADLYPFQRLDVVEARAQERASQDDLEGLAAAAYAEFPRLKKQMLHSDNAPVFHAMAEGLATGQSYAFLFNHDVITNVPLGFIAAEAALVQAARDLSMELPEHHRRMTVSKLLSRIMVFGMPAVNILAKPGVVDMSIPPSKTIVEAGITDNVRKTFNGSYKAVRSLVSAAELAGGTAKPVVDAFAGSGTKDTYVPRLLAKQKQPSAVHMGPMSPATVGLFEGERIVTIAVHVDDPKPKSAVGSIHEAPDTADGGHLLMHEVERLAERATHVRHMYHIDKDEYDKAIEKKKMVRKLGEERLDV